MGLLDPAAMLTHTASYSVPDDAAFSFTGNASDRERQDEEEADNTSASEQAVSK
jgi:hypothetical protein